MTGETGNKPSLSVEAAEQKIEERVRSVGKAATRLAGTLRERGKGTNLQVWRGCGKHHYKDFVGSAWLIQRQPVHPYDGLCLLTSGSVVYHQQDPRQSQQPTARRPVDAIVMQTVDFGSGSLKDDLVERRSYFIGIREILVERRLAHSRRLGEANLLPPEATGQSRVYGPHLYPPSEAEFDLGIYPRLTNDRHVSQEAATSYEYALAYEKLLEGFASDMGVDFRP